MLYAEDYDSKISRRDSSASFQENFRWTVERFTLFLVQGLFLHQKTDLLKMLKIKTVIYLVNKWKWSYFDTLSASVNNNYNYIRHYNSDQRFDGNNNKQVWEAPGF